MTIASWIAVVGTLAATRVIPRELGGFSLFVGMAIALVASIVAAARKR